MKNQLKKFLSNFVLIFSVVLMATACGNNVSNQIALSSETSEETIAEQRETQEELESQEEHILESNDKNIVVLFTNDVHCGINDNIGYAGVAELKKRALEEGNYVALVDSGDFLQGAPIGTLSKGKFIVDIMKKVGYDFCVPGDHEFDYGMENFLSICYELNNTIFSTNLIDLRNNKPVLSPYKIMNFGNKKIAFVGVSTPESFTKSTPKYFQDDNGNYIYSFLEDETGETLYNATQKSIDDAKVDGADYIILVGHLGDNGTTERWKSTTVIANTTGIDMVIDGHSHEVYNKIVQDKSGKDVLLAQTGTKLQNVGKLTISKDGIFSVEMIDSNSSIEELAQPLESTPSEIFDLNEKTTEEKVKDVNTQSFIDDIENKFKENLSEVIVKDNKVNLTINYPNSDKRAVRSAETNLGDLCADAFRAVVESDIGIMNGGGIRSSLPIRDITYNDCLTVMPFNNMITMIKCSGQIIKDALEMGAHMLPEENGGFMQVSGLTYTVNAATPSNIVLDEKNNFVSVDGEYRVSDIKVNGEELDLNKEYTVAGIDYTLINGGDGFTMFKGAEVLREGVIPDIDALVQYLKEKNIEDYINEEGNGRITIKN